MADDVPLLQLTDVTRKFPVAENGGSLVVLQSVSVEFSGGESVAIIGPSGSGKSTLLNIIGTLDEPTSGTVVFDGQNLGNLNEVNQIIDKNHSFNDIALLRRELVSKSYLQRENDGSVYWRIN